MKHRWTIYCGSRFIDSGTIESENEREGIREVMNQERQLKDDESYSVTVGGTSMSSYGDEFAQSAEGAGWGSDVMKGAYHFEKKPPFASGGVVTDIYTIESHGKFITPDLLPKICQGNISGKHDYGGNVYVDDGGWYQRCSECKTKVAYTKITEQTARGNIPSDSDRERERKRLQVIGKDPIGVAVTSGSLGELINIERWDGHTIRERCEGNVMWGEKVWFRGTGVVSHKDLK